MQESSPEVDEGPPVVEVGERDVDPLLEAPAEGVVDQPRVVGRRQHHHHVAALLDPTAATFVSMQRTMPPSFKDLLNLH